MIEAVADEYKPLFVVTAVTGMRIGEMRWQDEDLDAKKLTVRHNLRRGQLGTPKTKASAKTRNLSDLLVTAFRIQRLKSRFTQPDDFISFARQQTRERIFQSLGKAGRQRPGAWLPEHMKRAAFIEHFVIPCAALLAIEA